MPKAGLVIDLRDNGGGELDFTRELLKLLMDGIIPPDPSTLRASKSMLSFLDCAISNTLSGEFQALLIAQREAAKSALLVGEMFSGPTTDFNIVQSVEPNRTQVCQGPTVTLVSGNSYSAAGYFAALQVGQNLSVLVGVDENSGAVGASTLPYSVLENLAPSVFKHAPFRCENEHSLSALFQDRNKLREDQ